MQLLLDAFTKAGTIFTSKTHWSISMSKRSTRIPMKVSDDEARIVEFTKMRQQPSTKS